MIESESWQPSVSSRCTERNRQI